MSPLRALVCLSLLCGCDKSGGATSEPDVKPKPHAPVDGPAMWTTRIVDISVQGMDDQNKPKGEPRRVDARPQGIHACRLEKDPGNEVVTTWFTGFYDEQGKSRMTDDRDPTVPPDLVQCAIQPAINTPLGIKGPGNFKVIVKLWFDEPKPQPR